MDRALEVAKQRATQKRTKRRFTSSALRHMRKQPTRQTEQQRDQLQNVKVLIAAFLAKMEQEEYPGVYLRSVQISPVIEHVGHYLRRDPSQINIGEAEFAVWTVAILQSTPPTPRKGRFTTRTLELTSTGEILEYVHSDTGLGKCYLLAIDKVLYRDYIVDTLEQWLQKQLK